MSDDNHDSRDDPAGLSTQLIHHPYRPPEGFAAPNVGVHKASSVFFANVAQMRSRTWLDRSGYTYGLHGTPTTFTLEARLATLEGARHCMLAPSGLAAIAIVNTALLRQGDHVLLPDSVYQPNLAMVRHELAAWGITHAVYDAMDAASLEAALTPSTKVVWVEVAGSVTLEFPDLVALVKAVRTKAPQAVIALDNTWGAGIAFAPFDLPEGQGVDVCVHALTKYPSGGGDVLMGSVTCRDDKIYERLAMTHSRLGIGVGANDVEFVLRALPTLELRYHQHDAATREVAQWLAARSEFVRVLHPALPASPGHVAWKKLCSGAAGLVSVQFAPDVPRERVDAFVDALRLFRIGYSWGGPMSLVVPYDLAPMRPKNAQPRGMLVRFSIGLEESEGSDRGSRAGAARQPGPVSPEDQSGSIGGISAHSMAGGISSCTEARCTAVFSSNGCSTHKPSLPSRYRSARCLSGSTSRYSRSEAMVRYVANLLPRSKAAVDGESTSTSSTGSRLIMGLAASDALHVTITSG